MVSISKSAQPEVLGLIGNFVKMFDVLFVFAWTMKAFPNMAFGVVGVKDVAMAHVLPYESENAAGRYICEGPVLHVADLVSLLKKLYPTYDISAK
jgi:hypothetical protein